MKQIKRICIELYETLNTPKSLACAILCRYDEWDQLIAMRADPQGYLEPDRFKRDYQACEFIRKFEDIPTATDLQAVALASFYVSEQRCARTNQFLDLLCNFPDPQCGVERAFHRFLDKVRKIVARVLGPVPSDLPVRFGPGTTACLKGSTFTTLLDKLWVTPGVTQSCAPIFEHFYWSSFWGRERLRLGLPLPRIVEGNRFTTVPKDATTRRGICIEPTGNLFVQLGIGGYLKRRLSYVGLDVGYLGLDGQKKHRRLAQEASRGNHLATIDLRAASDTISFELVRQVLPPDWFDLLNSCRSPTTVTPDGVVHTLHKFSSMGNGYTFELETLIFAAIAAAASGGHVGRDVHCFGDDLIVPSECSERVLIALDLFGFEVNTRKTFVDGPFRESCGGDYFLGEPCTPIRLKKVSDTASLYELHNSLIGYDSVQKEVRRLIPRHLRTWGPASSTGLYLRGCNARYSVFHRDQISWVRTLDDVTRHTPLTRWGDGMTYVAAVLGTPSQGFKGKSVRSVNEYRLKTQGASVS